MARNALARGDPAPAGTYGQDALDTIGQMRYETANLLHLVTMSSQLTTGNLVSMALDVNLLQECLESVRSELKTGNFKAAAQGLQAARDAVITVRVEAGGF